jgi:hypothetical protein
MGLRLQYQQTPEPTFDPIGNVRFLFQIWMRSVLYSVVYWFGAFVGVIICGLIALVISLTAGLTLFVIAAVVIALALAICFWFLKIPIQVSEWKISVDQKAAAVPMVFDHIAWVLRGRAARGRVEGGHRIRHASPGNGVPTTRTARPRVPAATGPRGSRGPEAAVWWQQDGGLHRRRGSRGARRGRRRVRARFAVASERYGASPSTSPSASATPSPTQTGTVQVSPGVASNAAEPQVAAYLNRYFKAINTRDYSEYNSLLDAENQQSDSESSFNSGFATTKDTDEVLTGITGTGTGGGSLEANVSFTSHQTPADSVDQSACNNWRVSLYLVPQGNSYVMTAAPAGYKAVYTDC